MDIADQMKDSILSALFEEIEDIDTANVVYDQIQELDLYRLSEQTELIKEIEEINERHMKIIEKHTVYIESQKKKILDERKGYLYVTQIRQALNTLFNQYWREYHNEIENLDYEDLATKTPQLKRKSLCDKEGVKFALAVIHNKYTLCSKDLCYFYLNINYRYHPKIKPLTVILSSIDKFKKIKNAHPDYKPCGIDLDTTILDEIRTEIVNHKSAFEYNN